MNKTCFLLFIHSEIYFFGGKKEELCDNAVQGVEKGRWFSMGTPVSYATVNLSIDYIYKGGEDRG
jgi:hypothetical protein